MDVYDLWLLITLIAICGLGIVVHIIEARREWDHLNTCSRTRKSMARMIENE